MSAEGSGERLDFFVSHAGSDEDWAEWLAQQLEYAGYTVELDVWNWSAGVDVIQVTQRVLDRARRVLAVWSPDYFVRQWADMEHRVSFARSQQQPGWLLPVVVRDCPEEVIPVLYRTLIRVELVGLPEARARERLLSAVAGPSAPASRLPYPGGGGAGERGGFPGGLPPIWNVPNRNAFFVGREAELRRLAELLATPGSVAAVVGATDAGGVGRSELAVEYAWRHAAEFRLVWWLDAGRRARAEAGLLELAALVGTPTAGGIAAAMPALREELARRADWLLVVDGVPGRDRLAGLLPARSGRVLVTSHDGGILDGGILGGGVLGGGEPVVVRRFARPESVRLLRHRCSWLTQLAADRIAAITHDLPAGVAQAAQFLVETGMPAEEYLPRLDEQAGSVGEQVAGVEVGHVAIVAVGQERLLAADPAAADLLDQLALLAADPVPLAASNPNPTSSPASSPVADPVAGRVAGRVAGLVVGDPDTAGELVSSICGLGLAVRVGTQVQLRAPVRSLIAASLTDRRRALLLGRVLRLLATADPGDPATAANWPRYAAIAPHVQAAVAWLPSTAGVAEPAPFQRLLEHLCRFLRLAGRAQDSHDLAEGAYQRRRRTHGDEDPQALRWAVNRGAALGALGHHDLARQVLAAALARQQRVAGADDPETLSCAGLLGVTLLALGEHEPARALLLDTLSRRRGALGPEAPQTLQSAADLAAALRALGYHTQARLLLEDVTASRRRLLGPDHLDTLASMHELGAVLAAAGDHDAARGVLGEAVSRRRALLGPDHLDTLASVHALGAVHAAAGDYGAARDTLAGVAARRAAVLGAGHPDALASAHWLGSVLAALGDRDAARGTLAGVAARRRAVLGADHPDTLASAHELGCVLAALGDRDAAREVLVDTAARRQRLLGPNHQATLDTERRLRWL